MAKNKKAKRTDGRYSSQIYLGMVDGKRKYKTVYANSTTELSKKVLELKHSIGMGIDYTQSASTFEEWQKLWLAALKRKVTESQYNLYKFRIEFFNSYVGKKPVLHIKLYDLQEALDDLAERNPTTGQPSSKKTLVCYKSALNQLFEYLEDNRVLSITRQKIFILISLHRMKNVERLLLSSKHG